MKALFFSILIFNTAFFLWEYRKGAPDIYYPQEEAIILADNTQKIIFLPEEIEDSVIELVATKESEQGSLVVSENTQTEAIVVLLNKNNTVESELIVAEIETSDATTNTENDLTELADEQSEPAFLEEKVAILVDEYKKPETKEAKIKVPANKIIKVDGGKKQEALIELCFQVPSQALESVQKKIEGYQFNVIKQSEQAINYYFLLTERSQSLGLMKANAELIKQQGLEVWQIEKGEFSQRISLGVFSNPNNVKNAKSAYMKKIGQSLEIIPQYKNKEQIYLKITMAKDKAEEVMTTLSRYKLKSKQCNAITNSKN